MASFTLKAYNFLMIMGIAELALGILILLGLLGRARGSLLPRVFGGVLLIVFGSLFMGIRNVGEIRVQEGKMLLKVPFQRDKVVESGDILSVREVDIGVESGIRPVRKVSGGKIGDVRTGWFKLSNGEKAFLVLEGRRALYIETSLGFPALVGIREFDELEAAFVEFVYPQGGAAP